VVRFTAITNTQRAVGGYADLGISPESPRAWVPMRLASSVRT